MAEMLAPLKPNDHPRITRMTRIENAAPVSGAGQITPDVRRHGKAVPA
jgi:hypothetical protein